MSKHRSADEIAADIRRTGKTVARGDDARPRLVDLYVEGAKAGMSLAEMARMAGAAPGSVRRVLSGRRAQGEKIPLGAPGRRA